MPSVERRRLLSDWQSVLVRLSLTNDTQQTVFHTKPSLLAPGIDLIGISQSRIQEKFKDRALSAFGLFDVCSITLELLVDILL